MFFYLSKIFWFFVDPGNVLLIAILLGALLTWTRRRRLTRWWLSLTAVYALILALVPFGWIMMSELENRFAQPATLPQKVDGIVVLGGVVDQFVSQDRGTVAINGAVERLTFFARLANKYPGAKLVFSGGSGVLTDQSLKEADFVKPILVTLGIEPARLIFENQSRNTAENAVFSKKLVNPKPGENWIVITSAFHMPRTVGVFRQAGWPVIPYPVDYQAMSNSSPGVQFALRSGLNGFASGLHEWLGLTFYWFAGRTNEFYPGPERAR